MKQIINFLRNTTTRIIQWFRPKPELPPETEKDSEGKTDPDDAPLKDLSKSHQFPGDFLSEKMSDDLRKNIAEIMNGSWHLGYSDGAIGQLQMPSSFFWTLAKQVCDKYLFFLQGEQTHIKTALAEKENKEKTAKNILHQAEQQRNDVVIRRQLYPRSFSRTLFLIYTIIGVLLIIADIPLSLMVTQFIIDIDSADKNHEIKYLFFRPEACSESFIAHMWLVFCSNWQIFLMTIGIALSTIYFKIYYDDFMGYPFDKAVRQFRLLSSNKINDKGPDKDTIEKEEKQMRNKFRARLIAKTLILSFCIVTFWLLGVIRAEHKEAEAGQMHTYVTGLQETASTIGVYTTPVNVQSANDQANRLNMLERNMYILLTILLPLIGGICFSLGMGNYHNHREYQYAENLCKKRQKEHETALGEYTKAEMFSTTCGSFIDKCDNAFIGIYEKFFYSCYLHGYQRGVVNPDKNLDMFERARKFRDRLLATKSTEAIQRANEKVNPVNPFTKN